MDLLSKLNIFVNTQSWNDLLEHLRPKLFSPSESGKGVDIQLLAKVAELLTNENTPNKVKIILLKCLGNSCYSSYKHKDIHESNCHQYCNKLYASLANSESQSLSELGTDSAYFPYCGVCKWAITYISMHSNEDSSMLDSETEKELLRLCVQLLCNLFTFSIGDVSSTTVQNVAQALINADFRECIVKLSRSKHLPVLRSVCMFVHNALKKFNQDYFSIDQRKLLCIAFLDSQKDGLACARDTMFLLLKEPDMLRSVYEDLEIKDKLHLLNVIYHELTDLSLGLVDQEFESTLTHDAIEFLSERFCRRSDLILKTVDTYLEGMEPTEVIVLLDILGTLTSGPEEIRTLLQKNKSLLINCVYLLKSLHLAGKQSENYFTPVQKLNEVAPNAQCLKKTDVQGESEQKDTAKGDIQSHPAFGFKAGLIRLIGNMTYNNKTNQDIVREEDGIPLLLDCCNIDARNPLIMQWTILALRNLCEKNLPNQEVIANSTRVGVVDSSIIREMGLTLHEDEDGKSIGIMPLPRDQNK